MNGSPNSSMMLRSQCRSTPDLLPNNYVQFFKSTLYIPSVSVFVSLLTTYLYVTYLSPLAKDLLLSQDLNLELKRNYENCLTNSEQIIKREINLYDADKTNKADYALESGGATIVTTRCTKSYLEKNIQYSIDGLIPVFFTSNSPRVVIQPSITPGECWSFAGNDGVLVVQLSRTIIPTSFSYEHIRKELSPDSHIESAPKHFRVKSLKDANDKEGLLLGDYEYDKNGPSLQEFFVQNPNPVPTRYIEFRIQSNHGEMQYTCLYRFRVHGNKY